MYLVQSKAEQEQQKTKFWIPSFVFLVLTSLFDAVKKMMGGLGSQMKRSGYCLVCNRNIRRRIYGL